MSQAVEPYQASDSVSDASTCPGNQCRFEFPAVPEGRRLVLTSVSAQLGSVSDTIVFEGNGLHYFVTKSHPDLSNLTTPVSLYFEAGSMPTARVFAPPGTSSTSLLITVVGELQVV